MFEKILKIPAKFVDITIQSFTENKLELKDGKIAEVSSGESFGIGVRVLDKCWGFASSNNLDDIFDVVKKAHKMANKGEWKVEFERASAFQEKAEIKPKIDPFNVDIAEKKEILEISEKTAREIKEVVSTNFLYVDSEINTRYLNSEGTDIETKYCKVAFFASIFAKENGRIQIGSERLGGTGGLEHLNSVRNKVREASERAVRLLRAKSPPRGKFKVVLDPKLTGVFIHEALGHAAEADQVIKGESILGNKLGEKIASDMVTVYDDPSFFGSFGFYYYDSEGTKARKKALLKKGKLITYLHSRETASKLRAENTGNARAEGFWNPPLPRMSNIYVQKGDFTFEEIIDLHEGVYLKGSRGGEVDTARGVFQFNAEEGFMIKNGELKEAIKDVSLSGEILRILHEVDAVGKDFDLYIGFCGKDSQVVPVGDGGPHIRTFATVGGTT